jgi:twinkle protein
LLQWFAERGISAATIGRNRIWAVGNYVPALGAEVDCIAFPYFRGGELVKRIRVCAPLAGAQARLNERV